MEEKTRVSLISLLNNLMTRPAAQIFIDPVIPGEDCPPDYFDLIHNPICIRQIIEKLENRRYSNLTEFLREVELCWANAERYFGPSHLIGLLASEMRARFKKMHRAMSVCHVPGFCAEAYRLRARIGRLLSISPFAERLPSDPIDPSKNIAKQLPTETDLQNLVAAGDLLVGADEHRTLRRIIGEHQPELIGGNGKLVIVTTRLHPVTFKAARTFLRAALKAQGLEYPS
jgi:hypothetical protein